MQTSYTDFPGIGLPGQKCGLGSHTVKSFINNDKTPLEFGRFIARDSSDVNVVRAFYEEIATLVLSADLVADDAVDIDANGSSMTQVTYATSHDDTMTAIVAALNAVSGLSASLTDEAGDNRTIELIRRVDKADDSEDIDVTATVTSGGAGTATFTVTTSTDQVIAGLSVYKQNEDGNFAQYEEVGAVIEGQYLAEVVDSISPVPGDSVYVITSGDDRGKITNSSTNSLIVSGAAFAGDVETVNSLQVIALDINRP